MKIRYLEKSRRGRPTSNETIKLWEDVNEIIESLLSQGLTGSIRQIYYRLVADGKIPNNRDIYQSIGGKIKDGRMYGYIDWDGIEDRTRHFRSLQSWDGVIERIQSAARTHHVNMWKDQPYYVEVWVEKDAQIDVVESVVEPLDIPCFSCKGYSSITALRDGALRFIEKEQEDKICTLFYLGDHDPTGLVISKTIQEDLCTFGASVNFKRIALTMDQIDELAPPPQPAKLSDQNTKEYVKKYGEKCWELDALPPAYTQSLIKSYIEPLIEVKKWNQAIERQEQERAEIYRIIN